MTPEEQAEGFLAHAAAEHLTWADQRVLIAEAIRAAVAREREVYAELLATAAERGAAAMRERAAALAEEVEAIYELSEPNPGGPGRVVECREFADILRALPVTSELFVTLAARD